MSANLECKSIDINNFIGIWSIYNNSSLCSLLDKNTFSKKPSERIIAHIAKSDIIEDNPEKALSLINSNKKLFINNDAFYYLMAYLYTRTGKNNKAIFLLNKSDKNKYKYFLKCLTEIKSAFTFTSKMASITKSDGVHPHFGYLETLIRQHGLKRGAEVGVFMGYHSEHILQACRNVHLYLVDPYKVMEGSGYDDWNNLVFTVLHYRLRYRFLKYKRAHFIRKTSDEAIKEFKKNELDFVYLDADHRYEGIKKDLKMWEPKIKTGGIIAGHDYNSKQWPGVTKAVNEWAKKNSYTIKSGLGMFWYTTKK